MKFLLASEGISNESIFKAFKSLLGKPICEAKLVYIPTAKNVELGDKVWAIHDLSQLADMGFADLDIVDISAVSKEIMESRLKGADILYFGGGNTFYLMYWIRKSGLDKMLPELLKSSLWVGVSAGSMVAGLSIGASRDDRIFGEDMGENKSTDGLGLVDFSLKPHYQSLLFPGVNDENLAAVAKELDKPLYAIDDNTAIVVAEGRFEVVSEGNWKEF